MASFEIDGCTLRYEIVGSKGPLMAVTPGGRADMETTRPLANALSAHCRVLIWDRRNCGGASVYFGKEPSEQALWADDLAALIRRLGMGPTIVAGGSAGARVSLLTAIRHPDVTRALVVWACSGGNFGCTFLGFNYHVPFMMAAHAGGMEAVAKTPFFAERIAANPDNRARLLAQRPEDFVDTMRRWMATFYFDPSTPVIGATEAQVRALSMPIMLVEGNNPVHAKEVSDALQVLLPNVEVVQPPWTSLEYFDRISGKVKDGVIETLFPRVAPRAIEFIRKLEARGE